MQFTVVILRLRLLAMVSGCWACWRKQRAPEQRVVTGFTGPWHVPTQSHNGPWDTTTRMQRKLGYSGGHDTSSRAVREANFVAPLHPDQPDEAKEVQRGDDGYGYGYGHGCGCGGGGGLSLTGEVCEAGPCGSVDQWNEDDCGCEFA